MHTNDYHISGNVDGHTRSISCSLRGSDEFDFAFGGVADGAGCDAKYKTDEDEPGRFHKHFLSVLF